MHKHNNCIIFVLMDNIIVKIYKLVDPNTLETRYIGRTTQTLNKRLNGHLSKARKSTSNCHIKNWIMSLLRDNKKPIIKYITEIEGWSESYKYEQLLIKEYLENKHDLTNGHDRGEGGLLRNFTLEQRLKISQSVKKLHDEGLLHCGRKPLNVYDLNGEFIVKFESITSCAKWLKISDKQLQLSLKRKAKRVHDFQITFEDDKAPGKYSNKRTSESNLKEIYFNDLFSSEYLYFKSRKDAIDYFKVSNNTFNYYIKKNKLYLNKYLISNARLKQGELLENPTLERQKEDNQQPSLSSNTFEGSTTNSQVQTDYAEDGNANKSALPFIIERDKYGEPLMSLSYKMIDFSNKGDDIV